MIDLPQNLHDAYINAVTSGVDDLVQLAADLRKWDVPQSMIDRIDGHIYARQGNNPKGAQKLMDAFMATQHMPLLLEFYKMFSMNISVVSAQTFRSIINLFLDVLDNLYKSNGEVVDKAMVNALFAHLVYNFPDSLEVKKTIARKWLEVVVAENIRGELINHFTGNESGLPLITIRFVPYVMACAGMEAEVIKMNTIVSEKSKLDDIPFNVSPAPAEQYATKKVFHTSTDLFCNLLLDFDTLGHVLDIGCGPGRIGVNIQGRYDSITGVEFNSDYADYARNQSKYDEVIWGDALVEIPKLSRTFDFITSCMVLDYIPAHTVIRDAAKLLKPGGHLAFSFIPADQDADNVLSHAYHYEPEFYKKAAPDLTVVKCVMEPYMWTGGYYVLLKRDA